MRIFSKNIINKIIINIIIIIIGSIYALFITILMGIAGQYGKNYFSQEEYKIFLGIIGICVALASLSFRASSSAKDEEVSLQFYVQGIRLLYSNLLLIFSLMIKFFNANIAISIESKLLEEVLKSLYKLSFALGLLWFLIAFCYLYKITNDYLNKDKSSFGYFIKKYKNK
jgi:hypothetical protein